MGRLSNFEPRTEKGRAAPKLGQADVVASVTGRNAQTALAEHAGEWPEWGRCWMTPSQEKAKAPVPCVQHLAPLARP